MWILNHSIIVVSYWNEERDEEKYRERVRRSVWPTKGLVFLVGWSKEHVADGAGCILVG